jgi:hypothetical protein
MASTRTFLTAGWVPLAVFCRRSTVRSHRRCRPVVVVAVLSVLAGCGGSSSPTSPAPPSPASPAGTWSGTIRDPVSGDGAVRVSLDENLPGSLSGTWSVTFADGGPLSGPAAAVKVLGDAYGITMYVEPPPSCDTASGSDGLALLGFQLIEVVVTPSGLTAVAGRLSCSGLSFGSIELSKP